jgi:hypothetical protein
MSPGYKEHSTSKEAATKVALRSRKLRERTLDAIRRKHSYGATPEEVCEILNESILSIRPRFTELKIMNFIYDSGLRRKNSFNSNTKVWRYNDSRNE